jgi:hypothetical protein
MEDFLQHLGVGDEAPFLGDGAFEKAASINLVRMVSAHEVHWHVGIDENHSFASP